MNRSVLLNTVLCLLPAIAVTADEDSPKLKTVKARTIELKVPDNWQPSRPTSRMRAAQIKIPSQPEGKEGAELVVFYFGGPTGGTRANIDRWIGQFHSKDRKVEMFQGKCTAGSYILVDIAGTWKKPDGPPFARKTVDTPNSRVTNLILTEQSGTKRDYYFLKLSGPDQLVKKQSAALRAAIGAKLDSEKPFDLKNAED